MSKVFFPKVKIAREALKERALALLEKYEAVIDNAIALQDFETAAKHIQWLIEHMPAEEGERVIDSSAAKPKESSGPTGPQINIGIQLGGVNDQKALPAPQIIDVTPLVPND